MTVYVDNARVLRRGRAMSHMAADSLAELHAFVRVLGMRAHFHNHAEHPHYDVDATQRRDAITCGAVEVRPRQLLTVAQCAKLNDASK